MPRPLIIITNSDAVFLEMMADILQDEGYEALTVRETSNVFALIKTRQPALVIIELLITNPEMGLMIVNKMRLDRSTTTIPIIIASTTTQLIKDNADHLRAKRCDILQKPFSLEELLTIVAHAIPRT